MELQLRPDRPAHCHPRHPPNPYPSRPAPGRTYPDRACHPLDGSITVPRMHLTVDHALRNDIVIGIASCTRLTSGVSQIKNVVPSVGYTI
jgi:hypothetical protein